jgi:hypothetical protein
VDTLCDQGHEFENFAHLEAVSSNSSFSHELWKVCVVGRRGLTDHSGKVRAKAVQVRSDLVIFPDFAV